ncbi:MAG: PDZ domain-containing protein, partial [Desulfuromonadales bacterium]
GKERTIKVEIGRLDDGEQELAVDDEEGGGALGITAANVTPELVERYSLESDQGILITKIDPEGPAADANLRVGDLVIEADGKEIRSVKAFEAVVGKMKAGKVLRLLIQRRATLLYTTVTLE